MENQVPREPVAIIGVGLRLPGADSLNGFWDHLAAERSLISKVPAERWSADDLKGDPSKGNKTSSVWGGFIEHADCFDAEFFGISPREAAWMDPQQRFALEMAWHAIEDAGYRASDLAGSRTGVYMGVCHWDYAELLEKHLSTVDAYTPTGIAFSIIANRVSHFFDFQGPSITNDTACAASMTSLFEAVRAIQDGTCELALAGGVNLIWSPNHFVAFSKAGMLSREGRSKAFDEAADGYVRGEGGAVLLLKPLKKALEDNDPIHAVIKGIGINHGGRTNSLTVTNPAAQAELIKQVHREVGVSPDKVSYIEAHGPGTPLGDPIEISGLKQAFSALAEENGVSFVPESCGIGSVKTNIGHLEGAAGVAGIVKVLASLNHGRLPANVGFKDQNRLIDLSGSPFRIQKELTAWPRQEGAPRRACVSSFGFGGSNGHVLLEEAPFRSQEIPETEAPILVIPLSAQNHGRLTQYTAELLRFVEKADWQDMSLADIACTFQTAREPMEARQVFLARNPVELATALRGYLIEETSENGIRTGASVDTASEEASEIVALAQRWTSGDDVDWTLAGANGGRRIHLPAYPFERRRHWMDLSPGAKDQKPVPHPLLHRNTSGFDRSSFETRLTGDEFILADHHVDGRQVLPGVACLEMVRAATDLAGGLPDAGLVIENAVWTKPVLVEDRRAITVETRLERPETGEIGFSIRTLDAANGKTTPLADVPNATGTLRPLVVFTPETVDLEALKSRISEPVEPGTCYDWLRASGVDHGPAFRALTKVSRGEGEVLAQIRLPRRLQSSLETMPLHPVILDAAIQAWIATGSAAPKGAAVPFACGSIEVSGPCEPVMWAHVRLKPGQAPDAPVRKLDIDLLDKTGERRIAFRDLTLRVLKRETPAEKASGAQMPLIVTDGGWRPMPLQLRADDKKHQTRVLLAGTDERTAEDLARQTGWSVEMLPDVAGLGHAEAAEIVFAAASGAVREIMRSRPAEPVTVLVLAADGVPAPVITPLAGLLKTAAIESPKVSGRVVFISGEISKDRLKSIALAETRAGDTLVELRYDSGGQRHAWLPLSEMCRGEAADVGIDPAGAYWVTGGLGGLGRIFAEWLISKGARRLVLTGRSPEPGKEALAWLSGLQAAGAAVVYRACDVADPSDVEKLVARIEGEQRPLKGIIHAAGILDDGYILTQGPASAAVVFAPKLAGTVNLDEATRHLPLDFFVLCSSIASVFGNAGQAVYAAANAFLDAFAETRAQDVAAGERNGRTVAIAWPLWADGGMSVDKATLEGMRRRLGLTPLPRDAGLAALETILSTSGTSRNTVLYGDLERIDEVLADYGQGLVEPESEGPEPQVTASAEASGLDDATLERKTVDFVRGTLADVLEMDASRIRANRKLEEYGLDSIAIVEATNRLEEALGPLSKTLFFEFVDLLGVAKHLVEGHGGALRSVFAEDLQEDTGPAAEEQKAVAAEAEISEVRVSPPVPEERGRRSSEDGRDDRHDIAIVGLSLRVSNADTQDAFWKMLSEGIDGFEPVPKERWDNGALHHGERDVLGKTVVRTGAFLPDIDKFDPRYFRISQAEAELMSPEVRLFLQASVEAFEDAGYSRETMARRFGGDVAVIVGSMTNEYDLYGFQNMLMRGSLASGSYTGTVPNMVSYYYGFTGPSYFLDTMCSAASTCIHEAVHMLRAGRCKMALAGGVSLLLHPQKLIATSQEHFTTKSADVIRGYGLGAEGTILGEGVGALVLKSLVEAERDGDHVYGVIKGSGISNAGVRNGFTVPNPNQQAVAIEKALEDAGIGAETIGYIEGHGSGTALGDPIEVKALTQVFRKHTDAVQSVPIGTVKSNVAHLLGASGLAGIVKVLAQLKHGQLAPSLHAETLNPDIPFETSPFYVQRDLSPWQRLTDQTGAELPRRAGVTSIGAGGINSHIVIEEYRAPARSAAPREAELLVFSALTPDRLKAVLERFAGFLRQDPQENLADAAFTLQEGRNELTSRLALIAHDKDEALAAIETYISTGALSSGMVHVPSILEADPPEDKDAVAADCAARRLEQVASAWCHGASIDWDQLNRGRNVRRISLPAYPFEKIRCWYRQEPDAPSVVNPLGSRFKLHPFIGRNCSDVTGLRYRTAIHLKELRDYTYLDGGRETVLPTVAADVVAAATRIAGVAEHPSVTGLRFEASPVWGEVRELEISVEPGAGASGGSVRIDCLMENGDPIGWVRADVGNADGSADQTIDLEALRRTAVETLDAKAVYSDLKDRRLSFGPYLESIGHLWRLPDFGLLCSLREDQPQQDFFKKNVFFPAPALGAALEALFLANPDAAGISLGEMESADCAAGELAHVLCRPGSPGCFNVQFLDANGRILGTLSGVKLLGAMVGVTDERQTEAASAAEAVPAARQLQEDLRGKAAAILKFAAADLSPREAFHDLGFDSISLTRYANDISEAFGIDLSPAVFFECEHIEALADHLISRYSVKVPEETAKPAPFRAMAAQRPEEMVVSTPDTAPAATKSAEGSGLTDTRIAIIGMAGRFPQSPDVETFFDHLLAGHDLTSDMPIARYSPSYAERLDRAQFAKHGGFLDDIDRFDAGFFKVSPLEAERMDPQQRLMLETAWRTLEDAGYTPEELPRATGVFIGITSLDYAELWRSEGLGMDGYVATGNSLAMAANRLSHQFNLSGPSQAIDTACSSSLIAILRARDALLSGQCSAAIAGGVNLCLSLEGFEGPHQAGMLSPTGHCHSFGRAADGYARGEGVATLLLKRLGDAERDGDRILGVIAGGAENHGGRSGALTAPNVKAQARLIVDAMHGIDPGTVSYIEAHGTGTELGDPVEVNGLNRAYAELASTTSLPGSGIGLGTVKSNIGHLEAAAGIAGVVKVLMAMRRNKLPPTLHCNPINPHIDWSDGPFRVVTTREPWPVGSSGQPRRAGVSSFGFGGANAHLILESYDKPNGSVRQPLAPRSFASTRFWLPTMATGNEERDTMLFAADWQVSQAVGPSFAGRRLVVGCGVRIASEQGTGRVDLVPTGECIAAKYKDAAWQVLGLLRREMASSSHEPVLIQLAVPASGDGALYSGLGGMLQTASQEDPRIRIQVVEVPEDMSPAEIARWLREDAGAIHESHIRHVDGQRHVRTWKELAVTGQEGRWRDGGVYLIAGGMGGLGRLLAEHIARTAKDSVLVLSGSKPMDEERAAFLDKLRETGAVTAYRQVDLSDKSAVQDLVGHIIEVHGCLNGVVHTAGVLRDGFVTTKSEDDLEAVLAPKVDGALALRDACAGLGLDAFVLFSSLAGPFGNPGQADYAAANGFLDALASASGGAIKSVNWPLWRDGGMTVDGPTREMLFRRMGQRPLETGAGLQALQACLAGASAQVAVVGGDEERIRAFFGMRQRIAEMESPRGQDIREAPAMADLPAKVRSKLGGLFARVSGNPADAIDPQTPLEDYGIDSLMITKLNNELGDIFKDLPKTLFFRFRTLAAVADYLVEAQPASCRLWTGEVETAPAPAREPVPVSIQPADAAPSHAPDEPIAIIGMSGTYPDAPDLDTFWENLLAGHDAVGEIPKDRWSMDGFYEPDPDKAAAEGKSYSKWGAFLDGFADFDPLFFKLSPRDAAAMDPQERLFLMSAWQALEDAGYTRHRLKQVAGCGHGGARVGVFAGVTKTGYALHGPFATEGGATVRPTTSFSSIANRVSHLFDLAGPSLPVDTMCSSSLTAIHEACEHLRAGGCAMAIAGGVNLYLHPSSYVELSAAHMLSPSGQCRSFGEGADGFVPGEGVGCVLLKPLSRARADGDRIHALIRASAVNHGGRTNGYTVPNPDAQRDVVRSALQKAGLNARSIGLIEAHGTGTDLGDPIEVDGLTRAFGTDTEARAFCSLGSVKSAIGHLEAAAGIAGLTKAVLQMKNRTLVPSLHAERTNPNIDLSTTPFRLQREAGRWEAGGPRLAGVSSFGAGGANAHVILEEWCEPQQAQAGPQPCEDREIVLLSARSDERLREQAGRLLTWLRTSGRNGEPGRSEPSDIVGTLRAGLGGLLDVDPQDIDPDETLDTLGLEASHIPALRNWCEAAFGYRLSPSDLDAGGSVNGLAAILSGNATRTAGGEGASELSDIAYTLQVGREAMECRLAVLASDAGDLVVALETWLEGAEPGVPVAVSQSHGKRGALASLADDEVIREVAARAWETRRLETLMRLWVEGVDIDWAELRKDAQGRIVSLPTYPFERTRYWIPAERLAGIEPTTVQKQTEHLSLQQVLAGWNGDATLLADQERLETAVAQVLRAVLHEVPEAEIVPAYRAWFEAAAALLEDTPLEETLSSTEAWASWEADKTSGEATAQRALAEAALQALPEILTGRRRATDALFPDGRQTLVEAVYKENRVAARFSRTLAEAAARVARAWDKPERKLRILEIGAGTGGTSEPVFEALAPFASRIGQYLYTDISRAFLIHAERSYKARITGLETALLDIEKPLEGQKIETGAYDLVIAANVLHATADIHATLARVRKTLAPDGVLLLNETSRATFFTHVTFGLLDGWWRFTDPEWRIPGTPSLTQANWRKALEATGFEWRAGSTEPEQALGQQIVIASATGAEAQESLAVSPADKPRANGVSVCDRILAALSETLNMAPERIGQESSFADYGLDSILGTEFVHRLRKALSIDFDQTELYDFANVARLERHLLTKHPELAAKVPAPASAQAAVATNSPSLGAEPARQISESRTDGNVPIAIVGASGRFAKSETIDALWRHLEAGDDLVEPVSRFDLSPFYRDAEPGSYGKHGSFLDGIDRFDPVFFGISGVEATYMDPQQRLFLEEAWKTLENAGHAGEDTTGRRCGVFVGCAHGDYQDLFTEQPPGQAFWGNTTSLIPARISYWLDLKGPAVAIDTACSSSLVALHTACQSIRNGECDMALAGGVFVQCSPRFFRYANAANMLSPSGRCAAFGAGADGIVPGEAVGAVLLRPLNDALDDGDTILGVIVASGTNQDGTTNGITAPSASSQERLIRQVCEDHHIDPATIDYVEAHGTGTFLGDPIEHAALVRAYDGVAGRKIRLGSVKSNIGHATTAAGIAGLIKVLLSLRESTIPPTLHFAGGNPAIDFSSGPFRVNSVPVPWPTREERKRRAAISSFGFSGTNAHVVIEEAPVTKTEREPARSQLFVLSARTPDQLKSQAEKLSTHLEAHPDLLGEDVAFTLLAGRRVFDHRLALVADSPGSAVEALRGWLAGHPASTVEVGVVTGHEGEPAKSKLRLADEDGEKRIADLTALGRTFLSGGRLDAADLFRKSRRRVPLPAYPFAGKSYWVSEERTKTQRKAPIVVQSPEANETAKVLAPETGQRFRLAPPAAMAASVGPSEVQRSEKIVLPPLSSTPVRREDAGDVRRKDDADGVRVLDLTGPWGEALTNRLVQELDLAGSDETVRVIVLTGDTAWMAGPDPVAGFDPECVVKCAVPVIASVQGTASGQAAAMVLLCDFLVSESLAAFANVPEPESKIAQHLRDRRPDTCGLLAPSGLGNEWAFALARNIAQGPKDALCLLKSHMRRDLPSLLADLPELPEPYEFPDGAETAPQSCSTVPLKTDVMSLELFDDGVVLLTMNERQGRNMFTPAFMDGFEEAFARIAELSEARVVVLTGHDSYFACGGTRDGLTDLQQGGSRFTDRRIYSLPLECELPVIAAMQGHGIGAGWSLGMYCDHAIFAAEGLYHSNYLWYGFTPGAGATLIFPYRLGDDLGREVLFTACQYRGRELGERSPCVTVRPAREVLKSALDAAHKLARMPLETLVARKDETATLLRGRLETVLERELAMHDKTFIGNETVRARIAEKFGETIQPVAVPEAEEQPSTSAAELRDDLVRSLADDLMIDVADIRDGDSFLDLGLDSILAVTWIRGLNKRFEIDLPATAVYAHPTVKALTDRVAELVGARQDTRQEPGIPESPEPELAKPSQPVPADISPDNGLRTEIVASLAEDLMLDPAEITDSAGFLDLGLDSILAVTWIRNLNRRYGIELPATAVYAHPTVGALIGHIAGLVPATGVPPTEPAQLPEVPAEPAAAPVEPAPAQPIAAPLVAAPETETRQEAVAIVGASGRFPKAGDLAGFWHNIATGRDCIDEVPPSRWDIERYYDPDPQAPGKTYCKWMGALDDIEAFDAGFFNITPREAELMDPQQRLFLETAWHAIEDAAIDPSSLSGKSCGVYVSSGPSGYGDLIKERNSYSLLGSSGSILAARISYLLDLRGPCLSIDTACSSSLVAMAQACEALVSGTCDMALAGGACVMIGPEMFIDTAKVSMLSADGRCFSFDERANGFVPGEGVGAVVLKRLSHAERDGDPIHAVIRGWGVNQDGKTNGITAPNPKAQTALLKSVYERFDIDPATIGLVECHGTGTPLGDPIEVEGLTDAFEGAASDVRCAIGSLKSNVGHLLASAGIAGALKAMLALENRQIPPSINLDTLNSHIPFERTPFEVSRALTEWEKPSGPVPRRAAVSSFGFSGTNAHLVLEEHDPAAESQGKVVPPVFVLSARTRERLIDYAGVLERYVSGRPDLDLDALALTLQTGRTVFRERLAFTFENRDDLLRKLASVAGDRALDGIHFSAGDTATVADDDAKALAETWLSSGERHQLDKLAEFWARGGDIDWPRAPGRRLHVPGYPFARTRYWVEPASELEPVGSAPVVSGPAPLFGRAPVEGEIGRVTIRIEGDEPFLTTHVNGQRLMTGLFLPEMARSALERLSGQPVSGLTHLLWGRPVTINGRPRDLTLTVMSDAEGLLYRVEADGEEGRPWHLGSGAAGTDDGKARKSIAAGSALEGSDVTETFRAFAERCSIHSGPPTPEMARVGEVRQAGDVLTARLIFPRGSGAERQGLLFDPFALDAVWRLLAFRAVGCVEDAGLANALPFPLSIEAVTGFAPLGEEVHVKIFGGSDTNGPAGVTVELYDTAGFECLRLQGVRLTVLERSREIRMEEDIRS
ncbi:SDR family NAD(P)-dependent oxidoreductase [Roseibium aggregatum]|uniref:SDR family NAD(P)-dependent oxidoreductase n=1 Tax=Roseibium aggregatum TaxID=187304 RepID=A0A939EBK5_9HYPH|nr:SDR family NAD(P)-dependent oxidoreductase [Roseibium aggregatum]MBN9669607.1 SDR family NAD(P)-dependent oxidoreductase [Roseibium aggregatum]